MQAQQAVSLRLMRKKETAKSYELSAIGVTTFGEAFVALDENDKALLPAMLYTDPIGEEECKKLCDVLGE